MINQPNTIEPEKIVYTNYFEIEGCEEIAEETCPFLKRLAELDLEIIKDVEVSFYLADSGKHITEHLSFKEFKNRISNDKKFLSLFYIVLEGKDYEIEQFGAEVRVKSFNKTKADLIYNLIK